MSWFTEIAGKAEDLLNKVDQTAATALQKNAVKSPNFKNSYNVQNLNQSIDEQCFTTNREISSNQNVNASNMTLKPSEPISASTSKVVSPRKKSESDDEKLMRFLNSEPLPTPKRKIKETALSTKVDVNLEDPSKAEAGLQSSKELKRMTKKLDHWNSQISGNDKNVRELKEREKDMMAAIDAKDSQIAILKVRLQEADQELSVKRNIWEELKTENERMIKEHAEVLKVQNKTVESLQQRLQEVENELSMTKESLLQAQTQHMQQVGKMEEEHRHLADNYSMLQKKWTDLNERNKELTMQLKLSNGNFDALQQEYNDYKQKAQRILQSKEKLIASLKEGNLNIGNIEVNENSSILLNAEMEAVKQERDLLRDEVRRANELVETYRSEMQELEKISQNDMIASEERFKNLKELYNVEKVQKEEFQHLNTQFKEETHFLKEELARTKNTFQSKLQDREIEIDKLRRQLTAKSLSSVSQEELESRLHALTENLIQKQTIVEALSTEKNSLVLQLERLEQQLREAQSFTRHQTFVGINSNDTERKSKAVFLDNPFDSNLTRKVKKVYGTIDSFSIRLGVFFRRYPISRVFVIIYMLLLHFWVLFVLLTYEPEIHSYENPPIH